MWTPRPRAVLCDVGFSLTFLDGPTIARHAATAGVTVDPDAVHRSEPALRRELSSYPWPSRPGAPPPSRTENGPRFFRRLLELAGARAPDRTLARAARAVWAAHLENNVWCRPGVGALDAVRRLHAAGFLLGVVSNSEGTIVRLMRDLRIDGVLGAVIDSWDCGLAKPDPAIFALALERLGVAPADAVMVGDSPDADVAGARAAGMRAALLDPLGLHQQVTDVPRYRDLASFASSILATTGMLTVDPTDGTTRIGGCAEGIAPSITYPAFGRHPAAATLDQGRGPPCWGYHLPEYDWEGFRVLGDIRFHGGRLHSVWAQLCKPDDDALRGDDRMLAIQERWLREVVGCPSGEYPWGLVWNRYNINASWHDVVIWFHRPRSRRAARRNRRKPRPRGAR